MTWKEFGKEFGTRVGQDIGQKVIKKVIENPQAAITAAITYGAAAAPYVFGAAIGVGIAWAVTDGFKR